MVLAVREGIQPPPPVIVASVVLGLDLIRSYPENLEQANQTPTADNLYEGSMFFVC